MFNTVKLQFDLLDVFGVFLNFWTHQIQVEILNILKLTV